MLFSLYGARGATIRATDGDIGSLDDVYFDDSTWQIRYVVVDTGGWLSGRKVLLAPSALGKIDVGRRSLAVNMSRGRVENSPGIDTDKPVSRQYETRLHEYYGWTPYWGWGAPPLVPPIAAATPFPAARRTSDAVAAEIAAREREEADPYLRSARAVTGHHIEARDGEIGHVEDFLADDDGWPIRYMIVDTRNWLPGKKVLVSPRWIESISWSEEKVRVDLTRDQVKGSPEFDPTRVVERDYERNLYDYYGRAPYW